MTFSYVTMFSVSFLTGLFVMSSNLWDNDSCWQGTLSRPWQIQLCGHKIRVLFFENFCLLCHPFVLSSFLLSSRGLACSVGPLSLMSCCVKMFLGLGLVMPCLVYCLAMWCLFFLFLHSCPVPSPILLKLLFFS
jgi:hypothetical protein